MPPSALRTINLPFPSRGLHEASAISEQPPETSPYAVNVRSFDLLSRRDRGCQRAGLSRLPNVINSTGRIDLIRTAMLGAVSASYGGLSYSYTAAGNMIPAGAGNHQVGSGTQNGNYYSAAYQYFKITSSKTAMPTIGATTVAALFTPGFAGMKVDTITYSATFNYRSGLGAMIATFSPGNGLYYLRVTFYSNATVLVELYSSHGSSSEFYTVTAWAGPYTATTFRIDLNPTYIECKIGATVFLHHTFTDAEQLLADDVFGSTFSSVVYGTPSLQLYAEVPFPGTNLFDDIVVSATAANNADPLTEQVCYLQRTGGVNCITVGSVTNGFTAITGGVGTNNNYSTASQIDMVAAYGNFWLVDGVGPLRKIVVSGPTVSFPVSTAGTLPTLVRILALYRGRLFHGGILTDPFNYFASRSGDPLDYDYSALDSAGAFAGNSTQQAGLLSDYLTAMIPFGDVTMLLGMGSSLAIMRGDPKAGGDVAYLSREVGIASIGAWCRTPSGDVYFMARDGLYRIALGTRGTQGGVPEPISRGRLDRTLGRIDFTQNRILMSWDPLELGVKIVISPFDVTLDTTVVFWGQRKNEFWVDVVPAAIAPRAVCALRGSGGPGGIMLYGGYDGWIRYMNPDVYTDDGTTISSVVRFPPVRPYGDNVLAKMVGMRQIWGNEANVPFNAEYKIFVGNDPLSASSATIPDQRGTVTTGGYQSMTGERSRGNALVLEISNSEPDTTWQLEGTSLQVMPSGRTRA